MTLHWDRHQPKSLVARTQMYPMALACQFKNLRNSKMNCGAAERLKTYSLWLGPKPMYSSIASQPNKGYHGPWVNESSQVYESMSASGIWIRTNSGASYFLTSTLENAPSATKTTRWCWAPLDKSDLSIQIQVSQSNQVSQVQKSRWDMMTVSTPKLET